MTRAGRGASSDRQSGQMAKQVCGVRPLNGFFVLGLAAAGVMTPLAGTGSPALAAATSSRSDSSEIAAFYRSRNDKLLWLAPSSGSAAQELISLLQTAQADHLNP